MGGVFDSLNDQLSKRDDEGGISPLDLADLPAEQRKLMRFMLREVEMPYEDLRAIAEEDWGFTPDELHAALDDLVRDRWLLKLGAENITYEANLRRKAGSSLAKNIWSGLDAKIEEARKAREQQMNLEEDEE